MSIFTDVLKVAATALISVAVLLALTKLIGQKQISQMTMFDYINGISIGSIAAELATELESPWMPLTAMIVFGLVTFVSSVITEKSLAMRKLITGKPIIIMDKGVIYRKNMSKARLDISEFLAACRIAGYFDVSQIQTAVLETNGNISFLPKSVQRPVTPSDMKLSPQQETLMTNVVLDGHVLVQNLMQSGKNEIWLKSELKKQGYANPQEVFLAVIGDDGSLSVYAQVNKKNDRDVFE